MDLDFKKNLGASDRIARVVIGLMALGLVVAKVALGFWAAAAIVFALFQFAEAAIGY